MHVDDNLSRATAVAKPAPGAYASVSYSQFGEDLLIGVFFAGKSTPGFYVDVGAHHPLRFSNTQLLYEKGWRGINIDGDPSLLDAFRLARPEDVSLTAFVSDKIETVTFNRFSDAAVNTVCPERAMAYSHNWSILSQSEVTTRTLSSILEEHLPQGLQIDVLSVDAEGFDLKVLEGNDWVRYRPTLLIVEIVDLNLMNPRSDPAVVFMEERGYRLFGYIHVSAFFSQVP